MVTSVPWQLSSSRARVARDDRRARRRREAAGLLGSDNGAVVAGGSQGRVPEEPAEKVASAGS
jgi:hypothetical protein